ncbi:hypothetical protein IFM89_029062 [Coptis chinensis]|uniref:Transcription factor IIIC subunit Tfc1/Sfc1 triple barrel domain-containing protein n=1 Tax=Coptis chinensis TaxID=261450 RepID=A0A835MA47_9MAGN|nr:hypothetical protein IFM89_029062 [Coptis chinensis]
MRNLKNAIIAVLIPLPSIIFYLTFIHNTSSNSLLWTWCSQHPILLPNLLFFINVNILFWIIGLIQSSHWMIDLYWTVIPVMLAHYYGSHPFGEEANLWRSRIVILLTWVWSIRLTHSYFRRENWQWGEREDWRFSEMRKQYGKHWWWVSFFVVYVSQQVFLMGICLPMYAVNCTDAPWNTWDSIGTFVCLCGIVVAYFADTQLHKFVSSNKILREVGVDAIPNLDSGLWQHSRHPNYFGEQLWWWGLVIFGWNVGHGWTFIGSLINSLCLAYVTVLVEQRMLNQEYRAKSYKMYQKTTLVVGMGVIKDGTITGFLPDNVCFAVHYPGYPSSTSRAIETLGGSEAILKARGSPSEPLKLHFRPEDPYSHPAFGDLRPCNNLLLKISKKRTTQVQDAVISVACSSETLRNAQECTVPENALDACNNASQPAVEGDTMFQLSADIVARVSEAYHFNGMVDYQHVLAVHAHAGKNKSRKRDRAEQEPYSEKGAVVDVDQEDVMILVPPLFSPKDFPEKLALKPSATVSAKKKQEAIVKQRWEGVRFRVLIRFEAEDVVTNVLCGAGLMVIGIFGNNPFLAMQGENRGRSPSPPSTDRSGHRADCEPNRQAVQETIIGKVSEAVRNLEQTSPKRAFEIKQICFSNIDRH